MELGTTIGADSRGRETEIQLPLPPAPVSEDEFVDLVDALVADPNRGDQLTDLLREDHPFYNERGAGTIAEMRGWVLLGLARAGVSDDGLLFVLEELDTGVDPYLVATAACALRSYPRPNPAFAPFVMRALTQNRYRDDPVSFLAYADYSLGPSATSPVRELLLTLAWLGPNAKSVLPELEETVKSGGLSKKALIEADRTLEAIRGSDQREEPDADDCCKLPAGLTSKFSWPWKARRSTESIGATVFEDHDGASITFNEFFQGRPSIVVFFYTRCDNPLKCSLTVTKLARVQKLLKLQNLDEQIQTAAITYDPEFDLPERIRRYGEKRDVHLDTSHRMLRATEGIDSLRQHFKLGVNFVESLVNRHRLEVYILDSKGQIAASFERLHWDEQEVVDRAAEVLKEAAAPADQPEVAREKRPRITSPVLATLASVAIAFFPKCPICWAAYLSMLGVTGLTQIPYSPWLQPILVVMMVANVASVWWRGRATGRMSGPFLVTLGALAILASRFDTGSVMLASVGIILTLAGSLLSVVSVLKVRTVAR